MPFPEAESCRGPGWVPGVRTGGCGVEPLSVVKGTAGVFQVDSPVPTLMTAEPELGLPG